MTLPDRTQAAQSKARVLREALPWITRWSGRTVVVKYGGNAEADGPDRALEAFAGDVALLRSVGLRVVVVHGGGPQITALCERLGIGARFVDGQRVTDEATLEVARMVLLGQVNPRLVGAIADAGGRAVGLAGTDAGLLSVEPVAGLGRVGRVTAVDPTMVLGLLDQGLVPVIAPLGRGPRGRDHNVNADGVAGALAAALHADKLLYLTNVAGLYADFGGPDAQLLSTTTSDHLRGLLAGRALTAGMVPKVASVVAAIDGGVPQAHLLDGRVEHALLLEIFTDEGVGTMVTAA